MIVGNELQGSHHLREIAIFGEVRRMVGDVLYCNDGACRARRR
ncbi:MAG: hypothetical protein RL261_830 [Pseudomonadota bacterium]|jgi:hypothetical protein